MKNGKMNVGNEHAGIDHELRWDVGRRISWLSEDGSVRIPEQTVREFVYPGVFTAAGKTYTSWRQLCAEVDETGYFCRDVYGREVFCISERFPCFDSYDYANETRRYRWFFIMEHGKLTRVYYADGRWIIQVTEDVESLENNCREQMEKMGWPK